MSSSYASQPTFHTTLRTFAQDPGLSLGALITDEHIRDVCDDLGVDFANGEHHVWTPALTLWTLLTQCISKSKSCTAAVARALVLRVSLGLPACSEGNGAYCKARAKLPVALLSRLATHLGDELERQVPSQWQWKNRRVLFGDGTTVSGPDTPENPGQTHQKPLEIKDSRTIHLLPKPGEQHYPQ